MGQSADSDPLGVETADPVKGPETEKELLVVVIDYAGPDSPPPPGSRPLPGRSAQGNPNGPLFWAGQLKVEPAQESQIAAAQGGREKAQEYDVRARLEVSAQTLGRDSPERLTKRESIEHERSLYLSATAPYSCDLLRNSSIGPITLLLGLFE